MASARKVSTIALLVLVLIGGAVFYLASNLNGIVAGVIESQGSRVLGTSVKVSGVDIRLTEAAAGLSGLSIENPEGFPGNAMELGGFAIDLDASTLTSETVVINKVIVDGARINVIQEASGSNLQALLNNIETGPAEETSPEEESVGDASTTKVIINEFTLSGASASVSIPELNETREVSLPPIVVSDVGRATNGATAAQVATQILKPVIEKVIATALTDSIKERASEKINDTVGGFLKGLSGDGKKGSR
ncbi:hypothetical protein R0137_08275 [Congregibacter brevis]|uniref:AsmA domain-containing protein n=1 Tax=Congregibacter brevis TaxID=3081201 RepID=A0ABZ0IHQ3_9GAMM|nr:hypothetical protein R0137_08275 [Congregibacter sp. IMCC45268]